jgi:predicted aldo/keto reductase-like oxidoreductase
MEYVRLGKTDVKVSKIGFGGAPAGLKNYLHAFDPAKEEDRKRIIEAIHKAVELGINYFDTAPAYGDGQGEEIFGEALQGIETERIFLATKMSVGDKNHVRASMEASLKKLKRDSIDLIQIHGTSYSDEEADFTLKDGGMLDEMYQLKDEGLVRFIGFTSEDQNPALYRFIRSGRFDMMQICYNLIFQHPYDPVRKSGSIYEAKKMDMGIATMRPTTSMIFRKWIEKVNPNNTFDYTGALIQFVLSNPLIDVVLIGMRNTKRVVQNVEIYNNTSGRVDIDDLHNRFV